MGTDVGLRFKSTRGRGGVVENIYINNINMINIPNEPLLFDLFYGGKGAGDVGVHAGARVVLARLVHHQHVAGAHQQGGHPLKGKLEQLRLPGESVVPVDGLDAAGLVIGVLDTGQGKEDGGPGQNDLGDGGDVGPARPPSACPGPRRASCRARSRRGRGRRCGA